MKQNKIIFLLFVLLGTIGLSQKVDLITQQVSVENVIRDKVERTVNKFLNESQYIIIVNARMEFKPLAVEDIDEPGIKQQTTSPYTLIPGLQMPSIPTKQNIYQPSIGGSFQYSTDKYFLYGLEITIYVDENISTGGLQQNIKTLILKNIPEIADCNDCVKFENINFLSDNKKSNRYDELLQEIENLEQDRRDAEANLQNWRFEQLEVQLSLSEDARSGWEDQARNRENSRRLDDSTRMVNLYKIEKTYRDKQDSLYVLTSIKLDEALRGRIESEEHTKKELLGLIKMQIQGENISSDDVSDGTRSDLYTKRPYSPSNTISSEMWLMIIVVLLLLALLFFVVMKNKKPIYLKPKEKEISGSNNLTNQTSSFPQTQANESEEVQRSELQSLRQSAVSMSVSEKGGANQIVQDWLNDGTSSKEENAEENDNKTDKKE